MRALWTAHRDTVKADFSERIFITKGERALTFAEVIAWWRDDAAFRSFYCATLAATRWQAFFWEMPPVRRGHIDVPYEFMLIRGDGLARMTPDADAFAAQFRTTGKFVAAFPNLGGDAILVAPEQIAAPHCYAHLGAFVRSAPKGQQHELFEALAHAVEGFLQRHDGRLWISTSGLGVAWVHIRLDTAPKYYQYRPYALM